jgi:hypothetical protein
VCFALEAFGELFFNFNPLFITVCPETDSNLCVDSATDM